MPDDRAYGLIFDIVKGIIAETLGYPDSGISVHSRLVDDLDADSLDVIDMVMSIEGRLNINIDQEKIKGIDKVYDLVNIALQGTPIRDGYQNGYY